MLGGIISTITLSKNQKDKFLSDFDNLKKKGPFKCKAKYVIRLNFESDTLRLKACGNMIANRTNDIYFGLEDESSIIEEILKPTN